MSEAILRVYRGDSKNGETVDYKVPVEEGMVVLDALHYIQSNYDGDLAFRWNCKAAKCGSCSAEINGKPGPSRGVCLIIEQHHHDDHSGISSLAGAGRASGREEIIGSRRRLTNT